MIPGPAQCRHLKFGAAYPDGSDSASGSCATYKSRVRGSIERRRSRQYNNNDCYGNNSMEMMMMTMMSCSSRRWWWRRGKRARPRPNAELLHNQRLLCVRRSNFLLPGISCFCISLLNRFFFLLNLPIIVLAVLPYNGSYHYRAPCALEPPL